MSAICYAGPMSTIRAEPKAQNNPEVAASESDDESQSPFSRGVLEIPYLPPPLIQRLLPLSWFLPIAAWIGLVTVALTKKVGRFWWPSPQGQPVIAALWIITGVSAAWMVSHFWLVLRQRRRAVELARRYLPDDASHETMARVASLCLSYAGYQRGGFWWVWPHLNALRAEFTRRSLTSEAMGSVPLVWIVDDAPIVEFLRFSESATVVCANPVRVRSHQLRMDTAGYFVCFVCGVAGLFAGRSGVLPWGGQRLWLWIGLGLGFVLCFCINLRWLKRAPRLAKCNGLACLLPINTKQPEPMFLRNLSPATYILTPVFTGSRPFQHRNKTNSTLHILGLGTPRIELDIDSDCFKVPDESAGNA